MPLKLIVKKGKLISTRYITQEFTLHPATENLMNIYQQTLEKNKNKYEFNKEGDAVTIYSDVIIGRRGNLMVPETFTKISKEHCKISKQGFPGFAKWYIEDLNSLNGTFVARDDSMIRILKGKFPLERRDRIFLADEIELLYE